MCSRLFNAQTFQLNLANLADDEGRNSHFLSLSLVKFNVIYFQNLVLLVYILN